MHKRINPASIKGNPSYSHGIEAAGTLRRLSIAGQVGRALDGTIPDGIEAQAEITWTNLVAVLTEAGMTVDDLTEVTVYLVNRDDNPGFDQVRRKWLGTACPASTKIYVSGLADPRLLCEVQARAEA